jgi:large subunit ribosomal protein L28
MAGGKCEICGKHTMFGRTIQHKHSGAWRLKAPKKNRPFSPNVQKKRMWVDGKWQRIAICTRCLRTESKHVQVQGVPYSV